MTIVFFRCWVTAFSGMGVSGEHDCPTLIQILASVDSQARDLALRYPHCGTNGSEASGTAQHERAR